MFIEVLYADLTRQKVALEEIELLPKSNVLFILITNPDEIGKTANVESCSGFDHYAFCKKRTMGTEWIMLFGWDDGEFVWRRLIKPHERGADEQVNPPLGYMHVVFDGVHVDNEKWKQAIKIFDKEIA